MNPILVFADTNEMPTKDKPNDRMTKLAEAIMNDSRFEFGGYTDLPVDLQFRYGDLIFNAELKAVADYISSALGIIGHLYNQVLVMRELGCPCMVLVMGSDDDVLNNIIEATKTRYRGAERAYQIGSYSDRLIDFEANCEALGCPVRRWEAMPMKRLLSTAHKILTGGNLMSYRPKPANGERELASAAMLFGNGIGPKILEPVMQDYTLRLVPRAEHARPVCEMTGIGKKRAAVIDQKISMIYGMVPA